MTRLVTTLLLLASCSPPTPAPPRRQQQLVPYCSSSAECTSSPDGCRYCYNAHCSCVLPAEPKDAGVDAPGGTIAREVSGQRIR